MILGAGFKHLKWENEENICSIVASRPQYNRDSDENKVGHGTNFS